MNLSIQPLIDLADTDRELQVFIYSKSQLEKQIDTASSVVNQHKKTIEEKNDELNALVNEAEELKKNIQIQEQLILKLNEQVPKIRNEKEFAASKNEALASTSINLSGAGSGSHTLSVNSVTGMTPQTGVITTKGFRDV